MRFWLWINKKSSKTAGFFIFWQHGLIVWASIIYWHPVVVSMSKVHFWKQFTTKGQHGGLSYTLLSVCQRYIFESNSQLTSIRSIWALSCCQYVKGTFLKAIHNTIPWKEGDRYVVVSMSKVHFWKQFTTAGHSKIYVEVLLSVCQRYIFESNSQLQYDPDVTAGRCCQYVKGTFLKAIHNI